MKFTAVIFIMATILFSTNGWSETRYFKIPTQKRKPAKEQVAPQKPQATPKKNPGKSNYFMTIQVASFKNLKSAQHEASRLKSHAVSTIIRKENIPGKGTWYRVYVGKFHSKQDATSYAKELKKTGIINWSWVKRINLASEKSIAQKSSGQKVQAVKSKPQPTVKKTTATAKLTKKTAPPQKRLSQTSPKKVTKPKPAITSQKRRPLPVAAKSKQYKQHQPEKRPIAITKQTRKSMHPGRFSLGLCGVGLISDSASDFRIRRTTATPAENWEFESYEPLIAIVPNLRINDYWSIEAAFEQSAFTNAEMQFLRLGPKFNFTKNAKTRPYLRAAMVYGSLKWDEAPGKFDDATGAEIGLGADFIRSPFSFSIDAAYRQVSFDYIAPSDPNVSSTGSEVDFSGFTLSGILRYHF